MAEDIDARKTHKARFPVRKQVCDRDVIPSASKYSFAGTQDTGRRVIVSEDLWIFRHTIIVCFFHTESLFLLHPIQRSAATEITIAILPLLTDNYSWILHDGTSAVAVDPGEAGPVSLFVNRANLMLTHVLITHHHADHCGGASDLKNAYGCAVIGPDDNRIPFVSDTMHDGDERIILSERMEVTATPGHTMTHLVYHFPRLRALFTGDTLFCAGCGRIFEGTAADMMQSLIRCICVEDITSVYCGHEYTEENLLFATTVEPENMDVWKRLAEVKYMLRRSVPTVPSTVALERATNPFLRTGSAELRKKLGMQSATGIEVFAELRKRKDRF